MNKLLPIGIENYEIACSKYYIDKTLLIKEITDNYIGNSLLITRPRRFGKSLNLSMLDYYFNINKSSNDLFKDKKIFKAGDKYIKDINSYPVIHLNLKNLLSNNSSSLIKQLIELIINLFNEYDYLLDSNKINEIEKKKMKDIMNHQIEDSLYVSSLYFLSQLLYKHYNKKVVILIDEYDTPLEDSYQKGFYDEIILFFKKLYSSLLKSNEYLYFAVVTGVLEIAKESIFSDLNNLYVCSVIDDELSSYFGFTEEEVLQSIKDFNLDFSIDEIKTWYGGYGTNKNLFNPWSINNFITKKKFLSYWVNSGSKDTIIKLINDIPNSIVLLNEFINNKTMKFNFNNSISYKDIKNDKNTLFSYLVQSGYLIATATNNYNDYYLSIPNFEINLVFENEIIKRNELSNDNSISKELFSSIMNKDVNNISRLLKEHIINSFSYYDLINEKDYQIMLISIFSVLFSNYIIKSEVINKLGRCDIMISPKLDNEIGIIIEIKKYKGRLAKDRLKAYSDKALNQIKENEYYDELLEKGVNRILLYGFAFDDKNNEISIDEINN